MNYAEIKRLKRRLLQEVPKSASSWYGLSEEDYDNFYCDLGRVITEYEFYDLLDKYFKNSCSLWALISQ